MGGDIIVESNINEGATFILSLPLKQVAKTDVVEPKGLDIPVENFKKINVLVVEDSITNREVLCDMLEGMGHKVSSAMNGLESLDKLKNKYLISFSWILTCQLWVASRPYKKFVQVGD